MSVDLQIVMPVHNEAGLIGTTLKEWLDELSPWVNLQFIIAEFEKIQAHFFQINKGSGRLQSLVIELRS